MAQLRDAKTSQVVFEGKPIECVLLARELGEDEILYDDVGLSFDPAAVLQAHNEAKEYTENKQVSGAASKLEKDTVLRAGAVNKAVREARAKVEG